MFNVDIPACDQAVLMNFDIQLSGVTSIEVTTIGSDGTEFVEVV